MMLLNRLLPLLFLLLLAPYMGWCDSRDRLVVASYNLQNYLLEPSGTRPAKPIEARTRIAHDLGLIQPDVLAVQEIGPPEALRDLQERLRSAGVDLPHTEHVTGWDTNIFVAVLSRFPIVSRRSHSNDSFLAEGRRYRMGRGIVEVDLAPAPGFRFTLLAAHLKSKRTVRGVDEATLREAEATILRRHVDAILDRNPAAPLIVCGDLNDHRDSRPLRVVRSRGRKALVDTRPGEWGPGHPPTDPPRNPTVVWTHFHASQDTYSRFDYILLSPSMAAQWRASESYVLADPEWNKASDHRPVIAVFRIQDSQTLPSYSPVPTLPRLPKGEDRSR